jgi:exosortase
MPEARRVADMDGVYHDAHPPVDRRERRYQWRASHWVWAIGLVLASILVTQSAWVESIKLGWTDDECQYILLAPFMTAWLIWVRRWRMPYCKPVGQWVGLPIMLLGGWMWAWGYRHSAATFWHGGPVLVAAGAFVSVMGADVVRKFAPAFLSLLFLIPITPTRRHIIASPMEYYAAQWTKGCCQFFGLDVAQRGNLLMVNGTEVEVAEACSGIRQLVTFWLVSYVMAFSRPLHWYSRLLILLFVPAVAIISNVVRLVPTVWIYSYGAGARAEQFHDVAGWVMLIAAFLFIESTVGLARWIGIPIEKFQNSGI